MSKAGNASQPFTNLQALRDAGCLVRVCIVRAADAAQMQMDSAYRKAWFASLEAGRPCRFCNRPVDREILSCVVVAAPFNEDQEATVDVTFFVLCSDCDQDDKRALMVMSRDIFGDEFVMAQTKGG
jgi:hypothetical protein